MTTSDPASRRIKTTDTVFDIIETLQELGGATPSEIANVLSLAPSTIHDHLATLESLNYVVRTETGYRLGLKFLDHGIDAKNQFSVLDVAQPLIREAAEELGETVWLYVEEHDHAVAIFKEEGDHGVKIDVRGKYLPMHCKAAGKAMLASFPESRVDEIVDTYGLPKVTEQTITDRDELAAELDAIRDQGYALSDGEAIENVRGVASAVVVDDEVLGAVSLSGYRFRVTDDRFRDEIPDYLNGVTSEIEFLMTEHDSSDLLH